MTISSKIDSNLSVLVVGGAGYIGSHMVSELLDNGFNPIIFDDLSTGHSWSVPESRLIHGSLSDADSLSKLFSQHKFVAVMHFASFIQVGESVAEPLKYYHNNVSNTLNLLSAMQQFDVNKLVFSSTAAVYGTPDLIPVSETSCLNPENPYGRSKLMIEQILADCERAWGLKSASLRYFNAAGAHPTSNIGEAHDPESHIIPIILQVALGQRDYISINGDDYETHDGTCIRDYVHVCDLASAHTLALRRLLAGGDSLVCNLGNGQGYSILEVVEVCRRITGHPIPVKVGPRRAGDPACLVASAVKAMSLLGWKPQYADLETIVKTAWEWHRKDFNNDDKLKIL